MKDTLKHVSDEALEKLFQGLNEAYADLKMELGDEKNDHPFFWKLLSFSIIIDNEYFRRQKEKEETLC